MGVIVKAVYEKGVLRPLRPLQLADNQTVTIEVIAESEESRLIRELVASHVLTPPRGTADAPLSIEERLVLAERVAQSIDRPLSELIIEERREL